MSPTQVDTLTSADAIAAALGGTLAEALGEQRVARWRIPRLQYRPTLHLVTDGEHVLGAALTSGRPHTKATKIIDLFARDEATEQVLLDAVLAASAARGDAAVKWELAPGLSLPPCATGAGFVPMRAPWSAKGTEAYAGAILWLTPVPHRETGYYAQTTMFTCGAVAALIAMDAQGHPGLTGGERDRDKELSLWRLASNFPACEPVGLGVAMTDDIGGAPLSVEIASDHDGPVLVEGFEGFEREFREVLQAESVAQAKARSIPLRRDRVSIEELADRLSKGSAALLLIDEYLMHDDHGPHWITAHAATEDIIVVEDPWIGADAGETWVDTHELPIAHGDLDAMITWGEGALRGILFVDKR